MATVPALVGDKHAHSPSLDTATDPPPGDPSYFTTPHHGPPSDPTTGTSTPTGTRTQRAASDPSSPATPGGSRAVDYNTTAATPDDVDIPGLLFAIPYPAPLNAAPSKSRPSFLLYAPPRAAYRRPPETPDGKKGKEKLVKKVERHWQEEVGQGVKIGKGEIPDASRWQKTKGMFTRKASQAIQWLPDSNIEALSRVPPKSKMHQVLVFIPEDPTTKEIQDATGGRIASRLDLERQLQAARAKAIKRSAISGALLPVTGVIDVLCPIPLFAFEIDAAYFTSQYQGLKKASAMTSDVRLALEPTPHLGALSERLLQICYKLAPKQFPVPTLMKSVIPGTPMGLDTGTPTEGGTPMYTPPLPSRSVGMGEKGEETTSRWGPEERYTSFDSKDAAPSMPVPSTFGVPPPLPPRPTTTKQDTEWSSAEEEKKALANHPTDISHPEDPPSYDAVPSTSATAPSPNASPIPPPLPPRPPTSGPAAPSTVSLAPTTTTDPFTDTHTAQAEPDSLQVPGSFPSTAPSLPPASGYTHAGSTTTTDPFDTPDPSDAYSVTYTDTLGGSKPCTAPNTPETAWTAPVSGGVTRAPSPTHPASLAPSLASTAGEGAAAGRQAPPKAPPIPTAARALAEAVIRQVRAAVPPPVAERHALDDVGELARDIERCLEKGAREFVKTL